MSKGVCTNLHPGHCVVSYNVGELRGWGSVCVFLHISVKYLCCVFCNLLHVSAWELKVDIYIFIVAWCLVSNGAPMEQLSLVVMEMTDVTAGGKTCTEYYGVFRVVVWPAERHLICAYLLFVPTDLSPGNHHLHMWECPHQHFTQHTGRNAGIQLNRRHSASSRQFVHSLSTLRLLFSVCSLLSL